MRIGRTFGLFLGFVQTAAAGRAIAATSEPAATQPTTTSAPAATRPAITKLSDDMVRRWRWYRLTWAGNDIRSQSNADQRLVEGVLKADPAEVALLRKEMEAEYDRLAGQKVHDEFHCGRMASRLALAWTRAPTDKALSAVEVALGQKETCEQVCRWGLVAMQRFAGDVPEKYWQRYKVFLPGTVASMMSLIGSRAPYIDHPGALRDGLIRIRPRIEKLAQADDLSRARLEQEFEKFYQSIEPWAKLEADKAAVRKVLMAFQAAYNQQDDKAFAACWPAGHPATRFLSNRPLSSKIEPALWTIVRWEPVYVLAKGDLARAYVVSQYRSKDEKLHPVQLQAFPAKRDPKAGWKMN